MIDFLLPLGCPLVLYLVLQASGYARSKFAAVLFGGYLLRMVTQFTAREVQLFSHSAGGDSVQYEWIGGMIASIWRQKGIHFVTVDEFAGVGTAALPPNIFALVMYINGGPARFGCTALCALAACMCALNLYGLSLLLGASERAARVTASLLLFSPAFVLYSSDMFKDAIVLLFVLGAFGSSLRLIKQFTLLHALVGIVSLWGLWYVRSYLVFAALGPLAVGLSGLNSKSAVRPLVAAMAIGAVLIAVSSYTGALGNVADKAQETFDLGTSARVRGANATVGASGLEFEDGGSIYGALHLKLLYTLFAPFPWQGGSFGFHIGKIDAGIGAYYFYRALVAGRRLMREQRGLVLTFVVFVVPLTFVYALGVANVGLILRQRIPIIVAIMLFGSLSWPAAEAALADSAAAIGKRVGRWRARAGVPDAEQANANVANDAAELAAMAPAAAPVVAARFRRLSDSRKS